jgi:hypothetical protein
MIDHRFKGEFGRGRKHTPMKHMPLGTFGEENQPYGNKTTCKVPGGSWSVWLYSSDSDAMFGEKKSISINMVPHVLSPLATFRRSDDLASACRTWLSELQGRSHAIASYHCRTAILHLGILQFDVALSVLQRRIASKQSIGRQSEEGDPFRTPLRANKE